MSFYFVWLAAHVPLAAAIASRTVPLWGEVFGELEVLGFKGRASAGHAVWLCRCSCGAEIERTSQTLLQARRAGQTSMCNACRDELWRGIGVAKRIDRQHGYAEFYFRFGSLYGLGWPLREQEALRDAIEPLAGGWRQQSVSPNECQVAEGHWSTSAEGLPWCPECRSYDLREFHHDHGFGCEKCKKPFVDVWGCLNCTRVVCDECLRTRCPNERYFAATLDEIGRELEVSRERVRCIETKAIRKLRTPSRMQLLAAWMVSRAAPAPVAATSTTAPAWFDVDDAIARDARWRLERDAVCYPQPEYCKQCGVNQRSARSAYCTNRCETLARAERDRRQQEEVASQVRWYDTSAALAARDRVRAAAWRDAAVPQTDEDCLWLSVMRRH